MSYFDQFIGWSVCAWATPLKHKGMFRYEAEQQGLRMSVPLSSDVFKTRGEAEKRMRAIRRATRRAINGEYRKRKSGRYLYGFTIFKMFTTYATTLDDLHVRRVTEEEVDIVVLAERWAFEDKLAKAGNFYKTL